jgi:hypothetical protein
MKPSYLTATVVGAASGLVLALSVFTFVAAAGGIPSLTAELEGSSVVPTFAPSASATWYMVVLAGLVGGAIIAVVTWAVGRTVDPEGSRSPLALVVPVGASVAAIVAMVVMPLGVTTLGTVSEGRAVVSVADMVLLVATTGILVGGAVAWLTHVLVRPPVHEDDPELLNA